MLRKDITMTTKTKPFYTDYKTAATWGSCNLVLCNNLPEIDPSIYDHMKFDYYDNDTDEPLDIYQWYITDLTKWAVEWQQQTFDLKYTYSDLLNCYVLCVCHCGTSWDYVPCEVFSQSWIDVNKDKIFNK